MMNYAYAETYNGNCGPTGNETDITWSLNTEDSTLTITGSGPMADWTTTADVPWYDYRKFIKHVVIGEGVTTIGGYAFYQCQNLVSVSNPSTLRQIRRLVCYRCHALETFNFPEGLEAIGTNIYSHGPFYECTSLKAIYIPSTVDTIYRDAFLRCSGATSIVVAPGNPKYDSRDNCNAIIHTATKRLWYGCQTTVIPNGVETVSEFAFEYQHNLQSIRISKTVTGFGNGVFKECENLRDVYVEWTTTDEIPNWNNFTNWLEHSDFDEKQITLHVPCGCKSVYTGLTANNKKGWRNYTIKDDHKTGGICGAQGSNLTWMLNCDNVLTIQGTGAMADWSAETDVPWYEYRESITSVVLPYGLTHVGDYAFRKTAITKIDLPSALQTIGKHSFSATPLIEVCIPEGVTSIGEKAFISGSEYVCLNEACNALLRRVYLPSTLTELGNASIALAHLQYLTYPKSITTLGHTYYYQSKYPAKELYASWTTNIPSRYGPIATVTEPKQKMHIPYGTTAAYRAKDWATVHDLVEDFDERAIDLGLSVRWASCNVGATEPEEFGTYFMWGDTIARSQYKLSAYPYCGTELNTLTKYNTRTASGTIDNRTTLIAFDDAAYINWGETWRMPTEAEWQELLDNCTLEKITLNGAEVIKVTGPNGNFIYLPKVGYKMDTHDGTGYCYWSSSLNTGELDDGCNKAIYLNGTSGLKKAYRYLGMGVRAVYRREWPSFTLTICDTTDASTYTKVVNAGATYTLTAKEDDCHQFVRWSDGNTENPRTVTVSADKTYTAEFEPTPRASGTCGATDHEADVTWTLSCDSVLTISGTGAMKDWTTSTTIPWDSYKSSIKTVVINDGVTNIGGYAFYNCNNLTSVSIPNTVTTIGKHALRSSQNLLSLTIPNSVTTIGSPAFGRHLQDLYVSWTGTDILTYNQQIVTTNPGVTLHVPCGTEQDYIDKGWDEKCTIEERGGTYNITVETETGDNSQGGVSIRVLP